MRRGLSALALTSIGVLLLGACAQSVNDRPAPLAKKVIDEAGLNQVLLTAGDPNRAVEYFQESLAAEPERADYRRYLARALKQAARYPEAMRVYSELDSLGQSTPADTLDHAFVAMKMQRWAEAEALDAELPSGLDTARRHVLTGRLADQRQDWDSADSAYARAELLATRPGQVYNDWGFSKLIRGDHEAAEKMFMKALSYDSTMFSAKNSLSIARAQQGVYQLPAIPMTDEERAVILNNLAMLAASQNNVPLAKGLFQAAIDQHPQHYESAARRLASLETTVEY